MKKILSISKNRFAFIVIFTGMLMGATASFETGYSQTPNPLPCGNYTIDTVALNKALAFEAKTKNGLTPGVLTQYLIRIYFHICRDDDGSNAAATTAQIAKEFDTLVVAYHSFNICFLFCGVDYVNSTKINDNYFYPTDPNSLFAPYQIPNCINSFYMKNIGGNNAACGCGYGGITIGGIPGTLFLVDDGNIGSRTVAHETGHCLGLYHTFENFKGQEDIDESNCSTAGDLICDTKADPYVYKNNTSNKCFSVTGNPAVYNGTCTDPNGASNYSPPYTNLMSYWGYPNALITNGQYTRVNSFLSTDAGLQACESPSVLAIGPLTDNSGYYETSAVNTLITTGSVILGGTVNATLGGESVQLEAGVDANPTGSGALVLIEPSECSYPARYEEPNQPIADNSEPGTLTVFPNPSNDKFNFHYNLVTNQTVTISIYDSELKLLKQVMSGKQLAGVHNEEINVSDFAAGVYFARFETDSQLKIAKLVVIK